MYIDGDNDDDVRMSKWHCIKQSEDRTTNIPFMAKSCPGIHLHMSSKYMERGMGSGILVTSPSMLIPPSTIAHEVWRLKLSHLQLNALRTLNRNRNPDCTGLPWLHEGFKCVQLNARRYPSHASPLNMQRSQTAAGACRAGAREHTPAPLSAHPWWMLEWGSYQQEMRPDLRQLLRLEAEGAGTEAQVYLVANESFLGRQFIGS